MRYRMALVEITDAHTPDLPAGTQIVQVHYRYAGGLGADARPWGITVAIPIEGLDDG